MTKQENGQITQEQVMGALSKVQEPELHRDLVTLNMIRDVKIEDGQVGFTIMLTTPACPLRSQIEEEARAAVMQLPGVAQVEVRFDANVPTDQRIAGRLNIDVRNIVAVSSGKGGVGKTTVSVNLAVALAQSGARVGILDADIYGPNVPIMMGLSGHPRTRDGKIVPPKAYGVQVMSMGFLIPPNEAVVWRGPMLHSAIRQLMTDVAWESLDYMIVDLPPGTGDAQLTLAQSAPLTGGLIVTQPQEVALMDARRSLAAFRKLEVPVLGIIENMAGEVFGEGGGEKAGEELDVPFLGRVHLYPAVRAGGDAGQPIVAFEPESEAAQSFRRIAEALAARISVSSYQADPELTII